MDKFRTKEVEFSFGKALLREPLGELTTKTVLLEQEYRVMYAPSYDEDGVVVREGQPELLVEHLLDLEYQGISDIILSHNVELGGLELKDFLRKNMTTPDKRLFQEAMEELVDIPKDTKKKSGKSSEDGNSEKTTPTENSSTEQSRKQNSDSDLTTQRKTLTS